MHLFTTTGLAVVDFTLVSLCTSVAVISRVDSGGELKEVLDYPYGDPRQCTEMARKNGYNIEYFEVLPGFGWDNLRNMDQGQVINFNFSKCRITDDGRFLLPDSISSVPVKTSQVQMYAELIEKYLDWTSTTSKTVNLDVGLVTSDVGVSGKFSAEFEDMKSKQIGDKSISTRTQVRYVRYSVHLQPDAPLHETFRGRLLEVAAAHELNQTERARYLSQLVVRDFGTHVITHADAGAALMQVDQISENWAKNQEGHKNDILASASLSLFSVFKMGASYETKTDSTFVDSYLRSRTSSVISTVGGGLFRPMNFTSDDWAQGVDRDLVALDRSGDPLYYLITEQALPELPTSTLNQVIVSVREAIEAYYSFNVLPGCLDMESPNFAPSANIDDGSCKTPPSNSTFGGVYQTCTMKPGSNNGDLCGNMTQVNPMTGGFSCPHRYQAILLNQGNTQTTRSVHICESCWFDECCRDILYWSSADYKIYWCAATGPVSQDSGYLFGGLYTSQIPNPITRTMTCPPAYFPLKVGNAADLQICVSDDYEFGSKNAVPFAGFFSCSVGNPLSAGGVEVQQKQKVPHRTDADGDSNKPKTSLRNFFSDSSADFPKLCPNGYSKHLATIDQGCQIDYCVQTSKMSGPVLPPVKRPPFMPAPQIPTPASDNLSIYDPATRKWYKNTNARSFASTMQHPPATSFNSQPMSQEQAASESSRSPMTLTTVVAVGISIFATLACVALFTLVILAVRRRQRRGAKRNRRVDDTILNPQTDYRLGEITVNFAGDNQRD